MLYQISHGEPALDGLDEGLRHLVSRALAKDPAQRPSAQELLDVLTGRPHADTAEAATVGRTWAVPGQLRTTPDPLRPARALSPRVRSLVWRPPVLAGTAVFVVLMMGVGLLLEPPGDGKPPSKPKTVFSDDFSNNGTGGPA